MNNNYLIESDDFVVIDSIQAIYSNNIPGNRFSYRKDY